MTELNERISKIIEYSGYTASEFAETVDVQRSSISHITAGRNKPSLDFLIKVKERFPELQWDWIIKGEGEMLKELQSDEVPESEEKPRTTSLPDLFNMIEGDYLGSTESEDRTEPGAEQNLQAPSESRISAQRPASEILGDSQRLAVTAEKDLLQNTDNESDKVKRIVLFYESGKFESFEP